MSNQNDVKIMITFYLDDIIEYYSTERKEKLKSNSLL